MTKYKGPTAGDLVVHEESQAFCRESAKITNPAASDITALVGHPVKADGTIAVATEEASVVGLILEEVAIPASGTTVLDIAWLARGPAVVNQDKIAANDPNGAAYNIGNIVTALEALDMVFRSEPTVTDVQIN